MAVMGLQCGGLMMMSAAQPFAAAGGAALSCSFPPLSLCEQTRSLSTGEVSELLPVLSVQQGLLVSQSLPLRRICSH